MDLVEVDVARMGRWANQRRGSTSGRSSRSAACTRCTGRASSRGPRAACGACRCTSAFRAAGAAFGQAAGWERPIWFEPGVVDPEVRYDFADPSWFPAVREEVRATREGVALYDLTTYAKFVVAGPRRSPASSGW